jgi:SHS2 domain-containing protein
MPYEHFEHTADIGIRVRARDLPALFADAARGLTAALVENPEDVRPQESREFTVRGGNRAWLLRDWLNELLYEFDARQMLYSEFDIELDGEGLRATARGETADPARHRLDHEVKAVTYHGLAVSETPGGWMAEVILDI